MQAFAQGVRGVLRHHLGEGVRGLVDVQGHQPDVDVEPGHDTGPGGPGLDAQSQRGQERVGPAVDDFQGRPGARQPLDVNHRRLAERHRQAEVAGQGGLDDFFLDFAVKRHGQLAGGVVLPDVDQRVLLGELAEGGPEPAPVARVGRHDDRFQRGRTELVLRLAAG